MADPVSTAVTCFALLLAPTSGATGSHVIHGYPTMESAKQARTDARSSGYDAVDRIEHERYLVSPQHDIDVANAAKEEAERKAARLKKGCQADPWAAGQPLRCQSMGISGTFVNGRAFVPWDAIVVPEPCHGQETP